MLPDEGADLPAEVGRGAGRQSLHVPGCRLPAQSLVEVEAELSEQQHLEALQPQVQVRRLHGLLGLTSEHMLPGLFLPLEQLTPGQQLGVGAVEREQSGKETPLGNLSLAAKKLKNNVQFSLETFLHSTQDGVVEPEEEEEEEEEMSKNKCSD